MKALLVTSALVAFGLQSSATAQQTDHRMGEHPAIIVKRMAAHAGYDYATKFYPHPAWLYLQAEAPRPMMDHPAVIVAKRRQQEEAKRREKGGCLANERLRIVAHDARSTDEVARRDNLNR
jgi:hypothetical protein